MEIKNVKRGLRLRVHTSLGRNQTRSNFSKRHQAFPNTDGLLTVCTLLCVTLNLYSTQHLPSVSCAFALSHAHSLDQGLIIRGERFLSRCPCAHLHYSPHPSSIASVGCVVEPQPSPPPSARLLILTLTLSLRLAPSSAPPHPMAAVSGPSTVSIPLPSLPRSSLCATPTPSRLTVTSPFTSLLLCLSPLPLPLRLSLSPSKSSGRHPQFFRMRISPFTPLITSVITLITHVHRRPHFSLPSCSPPLSRTPSRNSPPRLRTPDMSMLQ